MNETDEITPLPSDREPSVAVDDEHPLERYKRLPDDLPSPFLNVPVQVYHDGRLVYSNDDTARLIGVSKTTLRGAVMRDRLPKVQDSDPPVFTVHDVLKEWRRRNPQVSYPVQIQRSTNVEPSVMPLPSAQPIQALSDQETLKRVGEMFGQAIRQVASERDVAHGRELESRDELWRHTVDLERENAILNAEKTSWQKERETMSAQRTADAETINALRSDAQKLKAEIESAKSEIQTLRRRLEKMKSWISAVQSRPLSAFSKRSERVDID